MKELQRERNRLYVSIKRQELELLEDAEQIREYLSFMTMSRVVAEKLYTRFSVIRNVVVGFRVVRSLLFQVVNRFRAQE